jgi:hypothetical protein
VTTGESGVNFAEQGWVGIAVEAGSELIVGANTQEGVMFSIGDPPQRKRWFTYETKSASLGAGIGGTVGQVFLVLGLNIATPQQADGYDGSLDFSLDLGLAGTSKYIRSVPDYLTFCFEFAKDWKRLLYQAGRASEVAEKYGKLKTIGETALKNAGGSLNAKGGGATLLQIPVVGVGLRVALNYKWSVTDVTDWGTLDLRPSGGGAKQR